MPRRSTRVREHERDAGRTHVREHERHLAPDPRERHARPTPGLSLRGPEELPPRPDGDYDFAGAAAAREWRGGEGADEAFEAAATTLKSLAPNEPVTAGQVRYAMRRGIGPAIEPYNEHGREFISDAEEVR